MKHCVNCGANMKFDIASQKMLCEHCGTTEEPENVEAEEAKTTDVFDTMIYKCTNCYGEVVADENEAAVFCPYCGDTTVLEGRIAKVARPQYIIPFQKTKSECIDSYKSLLRKSIYAPEKLRKEGVTNTFRGIYMPYWSYDQTQNATLRLRGETIKDNIMSSTVEVYQCTYDVNATYDGLTFDASKVFDDELSLAIAPYNVNGKKEFAPGYISGFYADTYDVESDTYEQKAEVIATKQVLSELEKNKEFRRYRISKVNSEDEIRVSLGGKTVNQEVGYHPVWFMATRFGERMAYATINGQTGKAAAIIPASPLKFVLFSLLTAIPLFFLLNMVSFLTPEFAVGLVNLFALYVYFIYDREIAVLKFREDAGGVQQLVNGKKTTAKKTKARKAVYWIWIGCIVVALFTYLMALGYYYNSQLMIPVNIVTTIGMWIMMFFSIIKTSKQHELTKHRFMYIGIPIVATVSVILQIAGNPMDSIYYLTCVAQLVAMAITFIDLIYYHNIIATKPMPQFDRTGGDDGVR